jgi:predicted helicase
VRDKLRLSKDRTALKVNDALVLEGIPPEAFDYRLGSRSALEWVIDQYQVKRGRDGGVASDPNAYGPSVYGEDSEAGRRYIVDLVGRVAAVSVETVRIVQALLALW